MAKQEPSSEQRTVQRGVGAAVADDWRRFKRRQQIALDRDIEVSELGTSGDIDQALLATKAHIAMRRALYLTGLARTIDDPKRQHEVEYYAKRACAILSVVPGEKLDTEIEGENDAKDWIDIKAALSDGATVESLTELEPAMRRFIRCHRPLGYWLFILLWETLIKNGALALAVAVISILVALVEPVHALLIGERPGWFALSLAIPVIVIGVAIQLVNQFPLARSKVKLFLRFFDRRPVGVDLHPSSTSRQRSLLIAHFVRAVIAIIITGICVSAYPAIFDERATTHVTVGLSGGIMVAVLIVAHFVDYIRWIAPHRPRTWTFILLLVGAAFHVYEPTWNRGLIALIALAAINGGYLVLQLGRQKRKGNFNWAWLKWKGSPPFILTMIAIILVVWVRWARADDVWVDSPSSPERALIHRGDWPHSPASGGESPIIVVAASGGGSRAAIYAAETFEMLSDMGRDNEVQLVSSVSGGSLATAGYVARRFRGEAIDGLADVVSVDFLLPVLRGFLHPSHTRGSYIEKTWREADGVGLGEVTLGDLAETWDESGEAEFPPFPIPMFNSASLDGHRVVLSPLHWYIYSSRRDRAAAGAGNEYEARANGRDCDDIADEHTWVFHRTGPYAVDHFVPNFDPTLAGAVRASANFPFGFPPVEVFTNRQRFYSPDCHDRRGIERIVRLTDGGVVSNSGLWTLYTVLMNHTGELGDRGVLLVIVDASKMPLHEVGLYSTIGDQAPAARYLHRSMVQSLIETYDGRLGVVEINLPPIVRDNTYTSWALDEDSLVSLRESFASREPQWRGQVETMFQSLRNLDQRIEQPQLARVPTD